MVLCLIIVVITAFTLVTGDAIQGTKYSRFQLQHVEPHDLWVYWLFFVLAFLLAVVFLVRILVIRSRQPSENEGH